MKNIVKFVALLLVAFAPCHVGSFSLSIGLFEEPEEDRCSLPPETGRCKARILNYFYNTSSEKCEIFHYGGCGGNRNNFESKKDCIENCQEKSSNIASFDLNMNNFLEVRNDCDYPKVKGLCRAGKKRYYFNGETCEQFIYGGCGGNPNNFLSKEDCMEKCASKLDVGSGESEDDLFSFGFF